MVFLSDDKRADSIDAFSTTSRYLDGTLNIYKIYFNNMVNNVYPSELQLNKAIVPLILKPRFWICICPFLMIFFLPQFIINVTILVSKLSISHF